ncbi:MAG: hypothetical protein ACPG66_08695 [Flavobacteriales bacterium]
MTLELSQILLAIGLMALAVAGIAIKILVKPGGEFSGTCASNNPMLRSEDGGCSVCGARPQDACQAEQAGLDPRGSREQKRNKHEDSGFHEQPVS